MRAVPGPVAPHGALNRTRAFRGSQSFVCLIALECIACASASAPGRSDTQAPGSTASSGSHSAQPEEANIPLPSPDALEIHLGEAWFAYRADGLGISADEARARDTRLNGVPPPGKFWDRQVAAEAWGLWTELCSQCHGGSRRLATVMSWPPPKDGWAEQNQRFFGGRQVGTAVFSTIMNGARAKRGNVDMPAWRDRLSHEQIWSMVYFVSQASNVGDVH